MSLSSCPACGGQTFTTAVPAAALRREVEYRDEFIGSRLRHKASHAELKDLDLFIVHEGSQGQIKKYVCTHWQQDDEFHCVSQRIDSMMKDMGITGNIDKILEEEKLSPDQLDRLSRAVLVTLNELKLL